MCSRYSISVHLKVLAEKLDVDVPTGYRPRYNAAPAQLLPVITNENPEGISFFYWGASPHFSKEKTLSSKLYNVSLGSLTGGTPVSNEIKIRRCLIPADGYYIWKKINKTKEVPYRVVVSKVGLFTFAGLWEEYEDDNEQMVHTFKIMTTKANSLLQEVSEHMPIILTSEQKQLWLSKEYSYEALLSLLKPFPAHKMNKFPISDRINNLHCDDQRLFDSVPTSGQFGNYTLFN